MRRQAIRKYRGFAIGGKDMVKIFSTPLPHLQSDNLKSKIGNGSTKLTIGPKSEMVGVFGDRSHARCSWRSGPGAGAEENFAARVRGKRRK